MKEIKAKTEHDRVTLPNCLERITPSLRKITVSGRIKLTQAPIPTKGVSVPYHTMEAISSRTTVTASTQSRVGSTNLIKSERAFIFEDLRCSVYGPCVLFGGL